MKSKSKILLTDLKKDIQLNVPEGFHEQLRQAIAKQTTSSLLESLKNKNEIFATPNNYFSELQNDISSQTTDLSLEPSFISKWQEQYHAIKNKELFLTPERYFDLLPAKIQLAFCNRKSSWFSYTEETFIKYLWKPVPILATVLCLVVSYMVFNKNNEIAKPNSIAIKNTATSIQNLSQTEILDYLASEDNSELDVVELASNQKINTTEEFKNSAIKVDRKTIEETFSSEEIEELSLEEL
jgi:hypothetical protein